MPQFNEVTDQHKPVVWNDNHDEAPVKELTAYQWLTSDAPEAQAWRKQVTMPAYNKVFERARRDNEHGSVLFKPPVEPIERPLTGKESTHGSYFDVPVAQPHATRGEYFIIPSED